MYQEYIKTYIDKLQITLKNLSIEDIEKCADILLKASGQDKNIFICGNGGSAATASHFASDMNKISSYSNSRFKIMALTDNLPLVTALSNDEAYNIIFIEQLKNFYNEGDVLIGISGSGNSENVLKAIEYVNSNKGITIGWTGYDGGKLKQISQYSINANINDMQISEDIHMIFTHLMMKIATKTC